MMRRLVTLLFTACMAASAPASAQVDFSGEWGVRMYEDQPERVPGPYAEVALLNSSGESSWTT